MRVAFCGLGNMGTPMASRLLERGRDVTVWNRTSASTAALVEHGAAVASTPADAAAGADVVITMLADGAAIEEVVFGSDGAAATMAPGSVLVEMSTAGPDLVRDLATRLPDGVELVDAPVKGGPARARRGELRILVGGNGAAFRWVEPVLSDLGTPRLLGPVGSGAAAKVLNNFAVISLVSVLGEAMLLADDLGIEEDVALEVLAATPLAATASRQWPRSTGAEPVSFKLRLAAKDLGLAVDVVRRVGRRLDIGEIALERLRRVVIDGAGERDQAEIVQHIRGREIGTASPRVDHPTGGA